MGDLVTPKPTPVVALPQLRKWRRVSDESAGSYRMFEVRRVGLEDGRGRDRGQAFTLAGKDWCNVIAVTPDDEIVLVWQYRFGSDAFSLEIPGGVIDAGEAPEPRRPPRAPRRDGLRGGATGAAARHRAEPGPAEQPLLHLRGAGRAPHRGDPVRRDGGARDGASPRLARRRAPRQRPGHPLARAGRPRDLPAKAAAIETRRESAFKPRWESVHFQSLISGMSSKCSRV